MKDLKKNLKQKESEFLDKIKELKENYYKETGLFIQSIEFNNAELTSIGGDKRYMHLGINVKYVMGTDVFLDGE